MLEEYIEQEIKASKRYDRFVKIKQTVTECIMASTHYFEGVPVVTLLAPRSTAVVDFQPMIVALNSKKNNNFTTLPKEDSALLHVITFNRLLEAFSVVN